MESIAVIGMILLIVGFILVGIELVMPGFGAPGIGGIISLILGIICSAKTVEEGLTITIVVVVILAVMVTLAMMFLKKAKSPIVLQEEIKAGYLNASDLEYLVGKEGVASTDLKPSGKCNIEGVEFDVRAESNYTVRGAKVRISRIHENTIMVREI